MKPTEEKMNIARKKDRIDELAAEIEKLRDARGKMLILLVQTSPKWR